MASAVDSEYAAAELYIKQLEEEIGLVFVGLAGCNGGGAGNESRASNGSSPVHRSPEVKGRTPCRERSTRSASLERSWSPKVSPPRPLSAEQCALLESSRSRSCASEVSVPWDSNRVRPNVSFMRRSRPPGLGRSGSSAPDLPGLSPVGQGCRPCVKRWSDINGNLLNTSDLMEHFSLLTSDKPSASKSSEDAAETRDVANQPSANPDKDSRKESSTRALIAPVSDECARTREVLPDFPPSPASAVTADGSTVVNSSTIESTPTQSHDSLLVESNGSGPSQRLEVPMSTSTDGGDLQEDSRSPGALDDKTEGLHPRFGFVDGNGSMNTSLDASTGFLPHDLSTSSQSEEEDGVFHLHRSNPDQDLPCPKSDSCVQDETERFPQIGASEPLHRMPEVGERNAPDPVSLENECVDVEVTLPPPKGFETSEDDMAGDCVACLSKHINHSPECSLHNDVSEAASGISGFKPAESFSFPSGLVSSENEESSVNNGEQIQGNQSLEDFSSSTSHRMHLSSNSPASVFRCPDIALQDGVSQVNSRESSSSAFSPPADSPVNPKPRIPWFSNTVASDRDSYRDSPPRTVADLLSTSSEGSWYSLESPGNETDPGSSVHSLDRKYLMTTTHGAALLNKGNPDAVDATSDGKEAQSEGGVITLNLASLEEPNVADVESQAARGEVSYSAPLSQNASETGEPNGTDALTNQDHAGLPRPLESVSSESSFESCKESLSREVSPETFCCQTGEAEQDKDSSFEEDFVPTYTASLSSSHQEETFERRHPEVGDCSIFARLQPFEHPDTFPQSKSPIQVHKKSKSFDNSELSFLMERDRRRRRSVNQQQDTTLKRGNQAAAAQKAPEQDDVEATRTDTTQARAALFPQQPDSETVWIKRPLLRSKSDGQNDRKASDVSAEISQSVVLRSEMGQSEGTSAQTASVGKDASCEESGSSSSGQSSAGEGGKKLQLRRRKTSAVDQQALEKLRLDADKQNVVDEQDFLADKSPEMQVVVNSSTPVLSRRRPFRRTLSKDRDAGGSTSSNSTPTPTPTATPKVSPRSRPEPSEPSEPSKPSKAEPQKESLFMDPAMANTWHGPIKSSSKPSRPKPRMGLGMVVSESTPLFGDQPGSSWMTRTGKEGGAHTLPSISRTMLDALHKKFYAFQYQQDYVPPYKVVVPQQISALPPSLWRRRLQDGFSTLKPEGQGHGLETVDEGWRSLSCHSSPRLVHRPATPENSPHLYKKLNLGVQERREAEIEAVEACKWLRAAGFPQYAQLYEDGQFPLEVAKAAGDHDFLDRDSMQSLFRRIQTLNKCAVMKIETKPRKVQEESDEEDPCALSDRWEYQKNVRRWSRREADLDNGLMTLKSSSSHDSVLTDQDSSSQGGSPVLDSRQPHDRECPSTSSALTDKSRQQDDNSGFAISPRLLRRAASERLKSVGNNVIKKVESFKSRRPRRKFGGAPIVEISGPVVADQENMQAKIQHLNCVDLSPTSEQGPGLASPTLGLPREPLSPVSSPDSLGDSASPSSLPSPRDLGSGSSRRAGSSPREDSRNDSSLSEYHSARSRLMETMDSMRDGQSGVRRNNSDTNLMEIFILPEDYKPGSFPKILQNGYIEAPQGFGINYRTGSLNLGRGYNPGVRSTPRRGSQELEVASSPSHRLSVYDNVPGLGQATGERDHTVTAAHHDLDLIMNNLFENIQDLTKTIEETESSSTAVEEDSASDSLPSQDTSREQSEDPALPSTEPQTSGLETALEESGAVEEGQVARTLNTSHSSSSAGSLDGEATEGAAEDSMDTMPRERRDSGVGASLTRGSSGRTRLRWPSFQKCHRPSTGSQALQVCRLTLCQVNVLRKLSLLRLTAIMEKFGPANRTGWNWLVPRFMKRSKLPDYSDRAVFGVPLQVIQQRTGQPLPQCVLAAMKYLRKAAPDCVGIFRKSGVRSRIQSLRQQLEEHPEQAIKFEELQAYDVADLLKQFFRELPECLLTNKLSDTFFSIFTNVPENLHMEAVQAAVVLLPDENREVLQSLLCFLYDITETADEHQMTAKNLAVCFAPSLFNMYGGNKPLQGTPSPRRQRKNPSPTATFPDQPSAHLCLAFLISECKKIFMISPHSSARLMNSCKDMEPATMSGLFRSPHKSGPDYKTFGEESIQTLLKECHDKNRGWSQGFTERGVEVAFKKPADNYPLREWKCTVEIEAPPVEVLNHIMQERHMWDEDLLSWSLVQKLDKHADVFQYSVNSMAPHPARHYVVLRYWRTDLSKGACAVVAASVDHPEVADTQGVRALLLASYFLVEPCGSGRSRLTHICRDDMRGRSVEWYNKVFGHICAHYLERIRETLKPRTAPDGPETKV